MHFHDWIKSSGCPRRWAIRGMRLRRKVIKTVVLIRPAISRGDRCERDIRANTGDTSSTRIIRSKVDSGVSICGIAATWICTKSFWFLRPTDELLSFRSGRSREEPRTPTWGTKVSNPSCGQASLGG